jgi:hypothetical protein
MIRELWSGDRYTTEELNARLKFFIGVVLGLTLFGIVFVVLYSLIFVTQPMNGMSPVDNKFFELIIPIATFLTGTLSGIMLAGDDKELRAKAIDAANKPYTPPPTPPTQTRSEPSFSPMAAAPVSSSFDNLMNNIPSFVASEVSGFGGKPSPTQPDHPEK